MNTGFLRTALAATLVMSFASVSWGVSAAKAGTSDDVSSLTTNIKGAIGGQLPGTPAQQIFPPVNTLLQCVRPSVAKPALQNSEAVAGSEALAALRRDETVVDVEALILQQINAIPGGTTQQSVQQAIESATNGQKAAIVVLALRNLSGCRNSVVPSTTGVSDAIAAELQSATTALGSNSDATAVLFATGTTFTTLQSGAVTGGVVGATYQRCTPHPYCP